MAERDTKLNKEMQEGSKSMAGKFTHPYSWIAIHWHFLHRLSCLNLPSRANFLCPPLRPMDEGAALCFINTLVPFFLYLLCLIVGEGEHSDILHSSMQSSLATVQILKEPPNDISTVRLLRDGPSSALPIFASK